tara:strand:+ start:142 stop:513 length:372 start_codon:yes stop_codon:yes gene_type:complete
MRELKIKSYIFTEYNDIKQVTTTTPSIFIIATMETMETVPISNISLDIGFLTSNPYEAVSFDTGYPILKGNEVILLLQHEYKTTEALLPIVLDLMEYHPFRFVNLDNTKSIELDELRELLQHQ